VPGAPRICAAGGFAPAAFPVRNADRFPPQKREKSFFCGSVLPRPRIKIKATGQGETAGRGRAKRHRQDPGVGQSPQGRAKRHIPLDRLPRIFYNKVCRIDRMAE